MDADHDAVLSVIQQFGAVSAESSCQQTIGTGWGAAALQVTENGQPRFLAGKFFEELGQAYGVVKVTIVAGIQLGGDFFTL